MGPGSLAEFELLVMLAALRLGPDEAYTVSIGDDITRRTGRSVRRANVYTTLERLEKKGLVSTRLGAQALAIVAAAIVYALVIRAQPVQRVEDAANNGYDTRLVLVESCT